MHMTFVYTYSDQNITNIIPVSILCMCMLGGGGGEGEGMGQYEGRRGAGMKILKFFFTSSEECLVIILGYYLHHKETSSLREFWPEECWCLQDCNKNISLGWRFQHKHFINIKIHIQCTFSSSRRNRCIRSAIHGPDWAYQDP